MPKPKRTPRGAFTAKQAAAAQHLQDHASDRTPREVLDAFLPEPLTIGGRKADVINLAHFMLLEKLGNPFADPPAPDADDPTTEQIAEIAYLITHPVADSLALIEKGRPAFSAAMFVFAASLPAAELKAVGQVIKQRLVAAFSTVIPIKPPGKKEGPAGPAPTAPSSASPATG